MVSEFQLKFESISYTCNVNNLILVLPYGVDVDLLTTLNLEEQQDTEIQVYDKYDPTLHGPTHNKK